MQRKTVTSTLRVTACTPFEELYSAAAGLEGNLDYIMIKANKKIEDENEQIMTVMLACTYVHDIYVSAA